MRLRNLRAFDPKTLATRDIAPSENASELQTQETRACDRKLGSTTDLTFGASCPWPLPSAESNAADSKNSLVDVRQPGAAPESVTKQELIKEIGGGSLHRVGELNVLRLKGSFREMGFQHGALLADQIPDGPLPYFGDYIEKGTGRELLGPAALVWPLIKRYASYRIAGAVPDFAKQTLEGLAEGAGIPLDELETGAVLPDTMVWLFSRVLGLRKAEPGTDLPEMGCTSAIAWGDATKDGQLLHGRNFDYLPVGPWPETASVIFHEPDEGQRYVSVASAGVPLGGITAMNESGLSLTVHQHLLTDKARLGGMPVGPVGDMIMREATSLEEAKAILDSNKQIGSWTYMVTDGKTNQVMTWEGDPHRQTAEFSGPGDNVVAKSNMYNDKELAKGQRLDIQRSFWRNNQARVDRAYTLLEEGAEEGHDPSSIGRILGDTGGKDCRIADAMSVLTTVASVVFEPGTGAFWVASGKAPTSHGEFIPFSLDKMGYAPERGHFTGQKLGGEDPRALEAFAAMRDSYLAQTDERDLDKSRLLARDAAELQPEQPLYQLLFALLSMQTGHTGDALEALDRAIELGHHDEERVASFHLWRGRVHDLVGDRHNAKLDYLNCLDHNADRRVHQAAKKNWSTPYDEADVTKINIDFRVVDVALP